MDLTYPEAIKETLHYAMTNNENVYLMGLGVNDDVGIFGSTYDLQKSYPRRVFEPPASEAAFTGAAIGSAVMGMKPVLIYQRVEFALLALDQIINHGAKIRYMSGGKQTCPIVIRIIVGKGWGNGAQHSQSLQSIFAHIPGLRVVMPSDPISGQGLLMNALSKSDPTIIIEHRDVFKTTGEVPDIPKIMPITPRKINDGDASTVVALSAMVSVAKEKYSASDIFDLVSLSPVPELTEIEESYKRTKKLIVMDTDWVHYGMIDHVISRILGKKTTKIGLPHCPTPTTVALEKVFYQNYDQEFKGPF